MNRFRKAVAQFDAVNCEDPNQESYQGKTFPKELLYAQRMTACLAQLAPDASEALRLAARSQHIARWEIPRSNYPLDRLGYQKWRTTLNRFHAEKAGEILSILEYNDETISRVQGFLLKKHLKSDPEMQLLEDVICLVFLESYFSDFSKKHEENKMIEIVQKTWKKMSARGHEAALQLDLRPEDLALIRKALSQSLSR
ncbi:MAG: DUF4202 domain-containing protein [Nitrospira sp.]